MCFLEVKSIISQYEFLGGLRHFGAVDAQLLLLHVSGQKVSND